jgi:tetratricopeptide (TPR) repeat protein
VLRLRLLFLIGLLLIGFAVLSPLLCNGSAVRWTDEGDRLIRDRDLIAAERAYNKAISIDSHYGPALYGKGWAMYLSGHEELEDAARQLFQRCIDYAPEYFGGYRGMGVLLMDEGKVALAERMLRTAYEKAGREPTTLISLGQLYLAADRFDEAARLFENAAVLAPHRGEFLRYMAELELARGDFDTALEWIVEGRSRPVSGKAGLLALDEGELRIRVEQARSLLEGAEGPTDPVLVDALQALDAADRLLQKAIQEDPRLRDVGPRQQFHQTLRKRIVEAGQP